MNKPQNHLNLPLFILGDMQFTIFFDYIKTTSGYMYKNIKKTNYDFFVVVIMS